MKNKKTQAKKKITIEQVIGKLKREAVKTYVCPECYNTLHKEFCSACTRKDL